MLLFIAYFIVGFLQDMLATVDVAAVFKKRAHLSAMMGTINTVLGYAVWGSILINLDPTRGLLDPDFIIGVLCYALGGYIGTIFAMQKVKYINEAIDQDSKAVEFNRRRPLITFPQFARSANTPCPNTSTD